MMNPAGRNDGGGLVVARRGPRLFVAQPPTRPHAILLEQALAHIAQLAPAAPGEEQVPLRRMPGRVLARDLHALHDQPPFDRSPLDGFALHSEDTQGAGAQHPVCLPVRSTRCAGDPPGAPLPPGQAVRIMTGAPLPQGADCVIRQEDTAFGAGEVLLSRPLRADENRVLRGEDYRAGELLLAEGARLDAAAVGLLAGAGYAEAPCRRRMRVALLSTGDELADPGSELPPGKIHDGNRFYLAARLEELGVECAAVEACGDDLDAITRRIDAALTVGADLVLSTGGVSVGQRDLLPAAMQALGARTIFHGLRLKPGSPALLALHREKPVLCLSGNPFAAAATFELLARPLLARLGGDDAILPRWVEAVLDSAFEKPSHGRRFVRGVFRDGRVRLPQGHSSGQMRSLLGCNCLLDIPAGSGPLQPGAPVRALLFEHR